MKDIGGDIMRVRDGVRGQRGKDKKRIILINLPIEFYPCRDLVIKFGSLSGAQEFRDFFPFLPSTLTSLNFNGIHPLPGSPPAIIAINFIFTFYFQVVA